MPDLKPYNPKAPCPKCGEADIGTEYCEDMLDTAHRQNSPRHKGEVLHRYCARCDYAWVETVIPVGGRISVCAGAEREEKESGP